jgi:uncharacterized protein
MFKKLLVSACLAATLALPAAAIAEPALWKVTNGTSTVYLYGSVHLLKHEAVWDTPKVEKALAESQELWLEIKDGDNPAAMQPLLAKYGVDPTTTLSAKLDDSYREKLARALQSIGAPPNALDKLRPWLASVSLSIAPLQKAGYDPNAGVDKLLKAAADKRGETVRAFETTEQQLRYFADMSPAEEVEMLRQTLDEFDETLDLLDRMEAAWERGDDAEIATLMRKDLSDDMYNLLIVRRNQNFARQIAARMRTPGVAFVAVGAGHLAGPDSVQAQLRGYGLNAVKQ